MKNLFSGMLFLITWMTVTGQSLEQIYEPVFVGRPTDNAFNGLVKLPDGELRHYGFEGSWNNPSSHLYIYSTDDGDTWRITYVPVGPRFKTEWPHKKPRWQNYAIEPTICELNDGRIWMLLRTSIDRLYESFSDDHGASWSIPAPYRITLNIPSLNGINYVHFQSTPVDEDQEGYMIESVKALSKRR